MRKEEPEKLEEASKECVLFCNTVMEDSLETLKLVSRLEKVQKEEPKKETGDSSFEKKMLRSVIIAVSHIIYLNDCFKNNLQDNASDFIRRAK